MAKRHETKRTRATSNDIFTDPTRLVVRRCNVCEWEDEILEPAGAPADCPWCHAPTTVVRVVATREESPRPGPKNPHAAALGRLGGLKGGTARAAALTPKERRAIAVKAARARWNKTKHSK